jgi:hypothetical protein
MKSSDQEESDTPSSLPSQELLQERVVREVLESASKLARAQNETAIKLIHLFWASLENLSEDDFGHEKLLLRRDTSYAQIRNQKNRVQIPSSEPLNEPFCTRDTILSLERAISLAIVSDDEMKAEIILLAILTLSDQEVLAAVKTMRIARNIAFKSWNYGRINPNRISNYDQGIAAYRALSQAGIQDLEIENLALRAPFAFSFSLAIQATLYHGAYIGREVKNKRTPNSFLALLLGEGLFTAWYHLVSPGDLDDLHTKLNTRTIDETVIPAIRALINSPTINN